VGKGTWRTPVTTTLDSSTLNVYSLWLDRHNALWIGTEETASTGSTTARWTVFEAQMVYQSDSPDRFFEIREGNLWLTTAEGVDCFHDIPVVNVSVREGLTGDGVDSILAARDGTSGWGIMQVWIMWW